MDMFVEIFILCLLAYLCGSIPFGMLLAKTRNIDIREHGSGNIGATNVTRIIGKKIRVHYPDWGCTKRMGDCFSCKSVVRETHLYCFGRIYGFFWTPLFHFSQI